jgi:hypothetical protein
MLHFAPRVDSLKSSATMDISAKAQELKSKGHDVIGLAAGEPDFDTPEVIRQACVKALAEGITRYTPAAGFLALREAVAEKVTREYGFETSAEEIVITSGAKHAIYPGRRGSTSYARVGELCADDRAGGGNGHSLADARRRQFSDQRGPVEGPRHSAQRPRHHHQLAE